MINFLVIYLPAKSLDFLTIGGFAFCLLQFATLNRSKSTLVIITLLYFVLITFFSLVQQQETTLRYLYTILLFFTFSIYFKSRGEDRYYSDITFVVYSMLLIVLAEQLYLRELIHDFYRAGNTKFHANRESGLFLYPGDLGAASAIIFTYWLYYAKKNLNYKLSIQSIFIIFILMYLIICSQSRMAILHVFISMLFFISIRVILYSLIASAAIATLFVLKIIEVDYFTETLTFVVDYGWILISEDSPLKRVQELYVLKNSMLGYDVAQHPFYESGVVSLYFKTGIIGILVYFSFLCFVCAKASRIDYRLLGIVVPIILISFISAPIDRPKLSVFDVWALSYVLNTTWKRQSTGDKYA